MPGIFIEIIKLLLLIYIALEVRDLSKKLNNK